MGLALLLGQHNDKGNKAPRSYEILTFVCLFLRRHQTTLTFEKLNCIQGSREMELFWGHSIVLSLLEDKHQNVIRPRLPIWDTVSNLSGENIDNNLP